MKKNVGFSLLFSNNINEREREKKSKQLGKQEQVKRKIIYIRMDEFPKRKGDRNWKTMNQNEYVFFLCVYCMFITTNSIFWQLPMVDNHGICFFFSFSSRFDESNHPTTKERRKKKRANIWWTCAQNLTYNFG